MKKAFITILFSLISLHLVLGASLQFVKYQVENGLSHNTVWCSLQDSYDFMWFGTSDGLNCFDGKSFRTFRYDAANQNSLGNNFVLSLYEDQSGDIWVGTQKGLYRFDRKNERFTSFSFATEDGVYVSSPVNSILKTNNGFLWLATQGQGIFIFDEKNKTLLQNSAHTHFVAALTQSPDGKIYASSRHDGLICFNKEGKYLTSYYNENNLLSPQQTEINAISYHVGAVWFNTGTYGFCRLDPVTGKIKSYRDRLTSVSNIKCIYPYSENKLWLGGDNGLYEFDIQTENINRIDQPSDPHSLSDHSIYHISSDREKGIWICTYLGGINYLSGNQKPFEHYYPENKNSSLQAKAISQFCEDEDGNIWIGSEDGGLHFLNTRTKEFENYKPTGNANSLSYHNIHTLMLDGDKLWIGTSSRGIDVYDRKTGKFKNYQHRRDNNQTICDNSINSIYKTRNNTILIGTSWGLSQYNSTEDNFSIIGELGNMVHVFDIHEDYAGDLWIATYNAGVFRRKEGSQKWENYTNSANDSSSICSNSIITIFEDKQHNIWFGSEGAGMCRFERDKNNFVAYQAVNKLIKNPVIYSIEQDKKANFWIGTNAGLIFINPTGAGHPMVYNKSDGLQSNQFNFRSSLKTKNGKMYFGGINGFSAFVPEEINPNNYVPSVRYVSLKLLNKNTKISDSQTNKDFLLFEKESVKLKYNENSFTVSFAALSFQAPEKNSYVYKLEGLDNNWIYTENGNNTVTFNNLPSGKYNLHIKGSNNDGLWNENATTLHINILPPFWETKFAYLVYFLILSAFAYWSYKRWLRRLQLKNEELIRSHRERQEKDNYLSKINFFTNISHEIRTPLTLIKLPLERILSSGDGNEDTRNHLKTINKNTEYLLNLINQLLDFRKTEQTEFTLHKEQLNIRELLIAIRERYVQAAALKDLNIVLQMPDEEITNCIDKEAFNKIISNLLSNAMKYAKKEITIVLNADSENLSISVADDGPGINESERSKIFDVFYQTNHSEPGTGIGLTLARSLTEKHGGQLHLVKNEKGGATFIITLGIENNCGETYASTEIKVAEYVGTATEVRKNQENNAEDKKANILLAEDNADLLELTYSFLSQYYVVSKVTNGKEALAKLSEQNFDVVVSDIMMPEMDGYQLCEAIKTENQYSHIPVVLLTAKTNVESKISGLEHGSDAYIEKPFSLEHLYSQIENLIHSRQKLKELFAGTPLLAAVEIAVSKKDKAYIDKLNEEIEKHMLDVNFSIDTLAEVMNMSRSNFYRKIKSISGMSPNDYLKTIRLKKAAELLLSQEYRINEVYEQAGFSSSSYFAKCFKEQFGMLPREFVQKSLQSLQNNEEETEEA
ncbi:MAG: response regulator [Paludibacteraceae bacterium]|nr:response regulator [Paludibacteraceae bacterium]